MRYQYDPDTPRHARLRVTSLDSRPTAAIGVTDTGSFRVVADHHMPPEIIGHALDYADRLAELIPEQTRPTTHRTHRCGKHRATP